MAFNRHDLIFRINEIEAELRELGAEPEIMNFDQYKTEQDLIDLGKSKRDQLNTKKKWLERAKKEV